jgi:hypothetical protein
MTIGHVFYRRPVKNTKIQNLLVMAGVQAPLSLDDGPDEPASRAPRRARPQAQPQVRDRG